MIIKIIPENETEARKHPATEFNGVKEFFIVGTSDTNEFHEWEGSYTYLMDSLNHFHDVIFEEKINRNATQRTATITLQKDDERDGDKSNITPSPFMLNHEGPMPVNVPLHAVNIVNPVVNPVVHAPPSIRDAFAKAYGEKPVNQVSELGQDGLNTVMEQVANRFVPKDDEQANPLE